MIFSFFPRPKQFFLSLLFWMICATLFWNISISDFLTFLFGQAAEDGGDTVLATSTRLIGLVVYLGTMAAAFLGFWSLDRASWQNRQALVVTSGIIWLALTYLIWSTTFGGMMAALGMPVISPEEPVIGLGFFVTSDFLIFYLYFALLTGLFYMFWQIYAPHKWGKWSILGSAFILFNTYFGVQVSVAINHWRRPFFDMLQSTLQTPGTYTQWDFYSGLLTFTNIAMVAVFIFTLTRFFVSHYIFRWRTAMNDYYLSHWAKLRQVEGASQRIQEDTMRFATIMEDLGVSVIDALMTLFAFLPILLSLSVYVDELPILGAIPNPLVWSSIVWAVFGTILLAVVGIKLPGLQFRNQRVEAAFRKELVYGEDDDNRAQPPTVQQLFSNVRRNYFRIYFHYVYFNATRNLYFQADNIFPFVILVPTFVMGKITWGIFQQILTAFGQVANSFQLVVAAWPTIVELLSIFKRLKGFEAVLYDKPLPDLDQEFLAGTDTDA